MIRNSAAAALALALSLLLLAGCGSGKKEIDKDKLGPLVAQRLAEKLNQPTPKVVCPMNLEAKVGARTSCTLTDATNGVRLPVTLTVDRVNGSRAHFNIKVGTKPLK